MDSSDRIYIYGGGLAGCEAAWQAAANGVKVCLYEMRPVKLTPAHKTGDLAELVCSNSFRSQKLENAAGLLKKELEMSGSLIMECANKSRVAAGGALAVDRHKFSRYVTEAINSNPNIQVIREEVNDIDCQKVQIIATGPLTSESMAEKIRSFTGAQHLYFYDAAAPIVVGQSLDFDKVFLGSRYSEGGDYINCPMTEDQYNKFVDELVKAERVPLKEFEKEVVFEGCLPIEVMAKRGRDTLRFGPLKPVGLVDKKTGKQPYAVVQLRKENDKGTLFNMVGFQTNLKWPEQKRIFRMIPGLGNAEFVRWGVMHRNTYINSPQILNSYFQVRKSPNVFFAGQITGVEGYIESAASGLIAGINAARYALNKELLEFPEETAMGALALYISDSSVRRFQPMNINFGLLPGIDRIKNKKQRNLFIARRALERLREFLRDEAQ
ncbi:MAG TPA: methylenetetrahydrofolate--tRNA-(uracil(54)-C(5))-methyltransferase (FADH(2)-oxidizing) TrmFO [Clostridiales bacterium]|nr:methylenetetrahydrofolate--tRNA-(uracil(54)-C(5))-methyltransferase (FADH(2)-oxidizing) TrmFO [Clostridiales bacterium]